MRRPRAHAALPAAVLAAVLFASCGGGPPCLAAAAEAGVEAALQEASERLNFRPITPCVFDQSLRVVRVFDDVLPGDPPQPRLNFVVERRGERAFVLSESRALMPFTRIPQNTHRIKVESGGITADGFAGPSGSGVDIAYLRWRSAGVTFELAATLHPWLDERDLLAIGAALMDRGAP